MKKLSALVLLLGTLTACFGHTPSSRFYMLESSTEQVVVSNKKLNIAVQDINFPQYLDRPQIVLQQPNNPEIKIAEFDRWATDFGAMQQNLLIENLQQALPKAEIKPLAFGGNSAFIVKLSLEKFGGWLNGNAYMQGSWQIENKFGKILAEQNFSLSNKTEHTYASYVKAQSFLLAKIANDIAERIVQLR